MFFYLSWQIYRSSGLLNKNVGGINKTNQLTQCGKVRPVDWRETEGLVRNMLQYTVTCTGSCDRFKLMSNQTPKWLDVSISWFYSREVGRLLKSPSYEFLPAGSCIKGCICHRFFFPLSSWCQQENLRPGKFEKIFELLTVLIRKRIYHI